MIPMDDDPRNFEPSSGEETVDSNGDPSPMPKDREKALAPWPARRGGRPIATHTKLKFVLRA